MTRMSVAVAALLIAAPAAFAQTTTTPPTTQPPAAAPSAPTASGTMKFYTNQPDQMLASDLIGLNIKNNANESIGEIDELILDKDGKIVAVVVGVGGFLGMGEREVALEFKSLQLKYDPSAMTNAGATTATVDATKESLKSAPAWTSDRNSGGTTRR